MLLQIAVAANDDIRTRRVRPCGRRRRRCWRGSRRASLPVVMPRSRMRCGSRTTLYCLTKPPTLATSATPSALASAELQIPVLDGARVGEVQLLRHARRTGRPSRRRSRPGPSVGVTPAGSRDAGAVEEFEHARARPVDVGAVLEDDVDERNAEEREAAHDLRFRHRQHRRRQRIGDLVLDHLRRLARIFRVDDDLRVGEIGDGVERQVDAAHRCRRRPRSRCRTAPATGCAPTRR